MKSNTEILIERMSFADLKALRDYCSELNINETNGDESCGFNLMAVIQIITQEMNIRMFGIFKEEPIFEVDTQINNQSVNN